MKLCETCGKREAVYPDEYAPPPYTPKWCLFCMRQKKQREYVAMIERMKRK